MTESIRDRASNAAQGSLSADLVERLGRIVGDRHILVSPTEIGAQSLDIGFWSTRGVAVLFPGSAEEIAALLRVAAESGLGVWTFSRGTNWGYGAKMASANGALILVLERMNRILEVNAELAYAVVEPGVTYAQLDAHLKDHDIPLWADCTDASPYGSIVGNALERGVGCTQYADHCGALCGLEAVLADGSIVRTGGGPADSRSRYTYKWGSGPFVDGLFFQSNLGIVTTAGVWLMPAPKAMTLFGCAVARDEELPAAMDALRRLSLTGVIQPNVHVSNDVLVFANLMQYPYERLRGATHMSDALRQDLRREYLVPPWIIVGAVYGRRDEVVRDAREIRRAMRGFGRVDLVDARKVALARRLLGPWRRAGRGSVLDRALRAATHSSLDRLEAIPHLWDTFRGVPGEHIVSFAYFKNRRYARRSDRPAIDVDPARDGCGMTWGAFACPITASDTRDFLACVRPIFERHGFDCSMSMLMINARTCYALVQIFFDRDDPAECARAHALSDDVLEAAPRRGFQQVRTSIGYYDRLLEHAPEYAHLLTTIKNALDPANVLAPGRYGVGKTS